MNIDDLFTQERKRELLEIWGFTFEKVSRRFSQSVYHNDVEFWDSIKEGVFWHGEPFAEPHAGGLEYNNMRWLNEAFYQALGDKLFKILQAIK